MEPVKRFEFTVLKGMVDSKYLFAFDGAHNVLKLASFVATAKIFPWSPLSAKVLFEVGEQITKYTATETGTILRGW